MAPNASSDFMVSSIAIRSGGPACATGRCPPPSPSTRPATASAPAAASVGWAVPTKMRGRTGSRRRGRESRALLCRGRRHFDANGKGIPVGAALPTGLWAFHMEKHRQRGRRHSFGRDAAHAGMIGPDARLAMTWRAGRGALHDGNASAPRLPLFWVVGATENGEHRCPYSGGEVGRSGVCR